MFVVAVGVVGIDDMAVVAIGHGFDDEQLDG